MTQLVQGIHLPDGDTHFGRHLEAFDANPLIDGKGTYQYQKIKLALAMDGRRGHALDIGGHVGLWSRVLAREFRKVTAFEPVPAHIECFRLNLAGVANVALCECALGDRDGVAKMVREIDISGNSHLSDDGDLDVLMRRLDSFELSPVDFVKIDVEGFELLVLRGGEQLIRANKPFMIVEQKGAKIGLRAAIDLLESWGAKVKWVKAGDFGLVW